MQRSVAVVLAGLTLFASCGSGVTSIRNGANFVAVALLCAILIAIHTAPGLTREVRHP